MVKQSLKLKESPPKSGLDLLLDDLASLLKSYLKVDFPPVSMSPPRAGEELKLEEDEHEAAAATNMQRQR